MCAGINEFFFAIDNCFNHACSAGSKGFELSVVKDKRAGMVGTHLDVDLDREGAEIRGISNFVNVVENSGISIFGSPRNITRAEPLSRSF